MGDISSRLVANSSSMTPKLVCGLDLGDKKSHVCVCTPEGEILERAKIDTTEPGLARYFQNRAPMRIALETGTHSPWASRLLRRWGHEVLVANPRKVRLIGNSRRKNDRLDALSLADLASVRPRLLYPIEHVTAQAQADRGVLRSRDALVRARASLILHTRGLVKAQGGRLPSCSADSFAKKVKSSVPAALAPALLPMLSQIAELSATIRGYDKQIQELIRTRYRKPRSCSRSTEWVRSPPWRSCSVLETRSGSARAVRWGRTSVSSRRNETRVKVPLKCESARRAIPTCVVCWCSARSTSWAHSERIRICVVSGSAWRRWAAARLPRREPLWPWPESSVS